MLTATQWRPYGTNIFERDWDTLLILDACRVDALQEIADEYDFLADVNSIPSVGSTSFEWMNNTFTNEYRTEIQRTGYITGNGYTESVFEGNGDTGHAAIPFGPSKYDVVDPDDFGYLEELWRAELDESSEWTVGSGEKIRQSPRYTTDRAIAAGRNLDVDRLIVHYMYPHDPFPLAEEDLWRPFDRLREGSVSVEVVWERYLDNLRYVLDEVEVLLENLESDTVVITADHGEAFGEYGFYRHVIGCPISCMRRVPWVETTAQDNREYEPTASPRNKSDNVSAKDRLKNLGYL